MALGPFVAADLDVFVWEDAEGPVRMTTIDEPSVSSFVHAGLAARPGVGGGWSDPRRRATARAEPPSM